MRYLGIDYGKKRVGIALSNESNEFALPHSVIQNTSDMAALVSAVERICVSEGVTDIVVGDSKDFNGNENSIMNDVRVFVDDLAEVLSKEMSIGEAAGQVIRIHYEPEFMTSAEAEHIQGKTSMHDASAAALILKSFMERKK